MSESLHIAAASLVIAAANCAGAFADPAATTRPATTAPTTTRASKPVEFPNVTIDRDARQVRVKCEFLGLADTPLEFFCVANGGPEHETVLRTAARPSHVHAGLLMLGLEPGSPVKYDETLNRWSPPRGPAIRIRAEWTDAAGKLIQRSAASMMCSTKDAKPMPPTTWIFTGSQQRGDGVYLGDPTGYIVSICNFEFTPIDVPNLVSSDNATLEWETDLAHDPPRGASVTMILEPADPPTTGPATRASAADNELNALRQRKKDLLDEAARMDEKIRAAEQKTPSPAR